MASRRGAVHDGTGGPVETQAGQGPIGPGTPAGPVLPLFYKEPQPLHAALHGGKGLKRPIDYGFAAHAHAVVLQIEEFRLAAAHYPIVFSDDDAAMPLAVLGYRDRENLFVDEAGRWAPGLYVPAYVRRYPFASGHGAQRDEPILFIDAGSDLLLELEAHPDAEPLFAGDEPSERTKQAIEFCAAFDRQLPETAAFVEAAKAHDLLQAKELTLNLPSGGTQRLSGLRMIDEGRFDALPDETFLEWRRRGWVPSVYWHWASADNFLRLPHRG